MKVCNHIRGYLQYAHAAYQFEVIYQRQINLNIDSFKYIFLSKQNDQLDAKKTEAPLNYYFTFIDIIVESLYSRYKWLLTIINLCFNV